MTVGSYRQFCPVAMAAEVLCTRWTIVLLREFVAGSTRFNELRRGVPRMSPALLSQRLKELEAAGIIAHTASASDRGVLEYQLTASGRELTPIVEAFGVWGQRRIETEVSLQHLDVQLLMWDMRRNLNPKPMPARQSVVHFTYPELPPTRRTWWLLGSVFDRSRIRCRPLRVGRSPDDDRDLDGPRHRTRCGRQPQDDPHRQPPAFIGDADVARPQPLRKRTETRELREAGRTPARRCQANRCGAAIARAEAAQSAARKQTRCPQRKMANVSGSELPTR